MSLLRNGELVPQGDEDTYVPKLKYGCPMFDSDHSGPGMIQTQTCKPTQALTNVPWSSMNRISIKTN